jgi:hypothetical protein
MLQISLNKVNTRFNDYQKVTDNEINQIGNEIYFVLLRSTYFKL